MQHNGVKGGEKFACQIVDPQFVNRGSDQLGQTRGGLARGRCGRQSEAHGRDAHVQGFVTQASAKMVSFVDHQKLKTVAEFAHVAPAALEGRHGDGLDLVLAVAQSAGRKPGAFLDGARPLVEQDTRGYQTQGRNVHAGDGRNRQAGLARAGGQDGHPAPVGESPCGQCCLLVGAQIGWQEGRQLVRWTGHFVLEPDAALA